MKYILFLITSLFLTTSLFAQNTQLRNTLILPIEVFGKNGATESVYVNLNTSPTTATGLKLYIHGVTYTNKVSVKLNNSPWKDLNNSNVVFLNPMESAMQGMATAYFTGPFSTFHLYVPFSNAYFTTNNTVSFRFNDLNGLTVGFRVLDIGIMNSNYTELALNTKKAQDDPSKWKPYSTDAARINNGSNKWFNATITHNGVAINAKCNDCHVEEGYDLKYFNYSNKSIVLRSTALHSLSIQDAQDIASFIRTRNVTYEPDARPWNPPYQPGPGLDSKPVRSWAAGAGLNWVLWDDYDMLKYIFPNSPTNWLVNYGTNGVVTYNPEYTLNQREMPLYVPLPDWNRWLPHIHPLDAFPTIFTNNTANILGAYQNVYNLVKSKPTKAEKAVLQDHVYFATNEPWSRVVASTWPTNWIDGPILWGSKAYQEYNLKIVGVLKWLNVKYFEMMKEFEIEDQGDNFGYWSAKRRWYSTSRGIFFVAPHTTKTSLWAYQIPNTPPYQQWGPESSSWYLLSLVLNDANRTAWDQLPMDQNYIGAFPPAILQPYKYAANPPFTDTGVAGIGWNLTFTNRPLGMSAYIFMKMMEFTEKGATNVPIGPGIINGQRGYTPWNVMNNGIANLIAYANSSDTDKTKYVPIVNLLFGQYCDSVKRFTPTQYDREFIGCGDAIYNLFLIMENEVKLIENRENISFSNLITKIRRTRKQMWSDRP